MSLFATLALVPLLAASPATLDPFPTATSPPLFPGSRSVLWVGAHPDDEVLLAPVLAKLCLLERLDCHLLVLTRGEAGICLLPGGCQPNLADVRTIEMQQSAALLGAELTLWNLPDGGGTTGWSAAAGSHSALVSRLTAFLQALAPDVVLSFDPRHGSTCHGDHKAAGELVVEAHAGLDTQPAMFFLETRATVNATPPFVAYSPAASASAGAFGYPATLDVGDSYGTWSYTALAAGLHPSQFGPETVRALRRMPGTQRVVYLAPAPSALADDDVFSCP